MRVMSTEMETNNNNRIMNYLNKKEKSFENNIYNKNRIDNDISNIKSENANETKSSTFKVSSIKSNYCDNTVRKLDSINTSSELTKIHNLNREVVNFKSRSSCSKENKMNERYNEFKYINSKNKDNNISTYHKIDVVNNNLNNNINGIYKYESLDVNISVTNTTNKNNKLSDAQPKTISNMNLHLVDNDNRNISMKKIIHPDTNLNMSDTNNKFNLLEINQNKSLYTRPDLILPVGYKHSWNMIMGIDCNEKLIRKKHSFAFDFSLLKIICVSYVLKKVESNSKNYKSDLSWLICKKEYVAEKLEKYQQYEDSFIYIKKGLKESTNNNRMEYILKKKTRLHSIHNCLWEAIFQTQQEQRYVLLFSKCLKELKSKYIRIKYNLRKVRLRFCHAALRYFRISMWYMNDIYRNRSDKKGDTSVVTNGKFKSKADNTMHINTEVIREDINNIKSSDQFNNTMKRTFNNMNQLVEVVSVQEVVKNSNDSNVQIDDTQHTYSQSSEQDTITNKIISEISNESVDSNVNLVEGLIREDSILVSMKEELVHIGTKIGEYVKREYFLLWNEVSCDGETYSEVKKKLSNYESRYRIISREIEEFETYISKMDNIDVLIAANKNSSYNVPAQELIFNDEEIEINFTTCEDIEEFNQYEIPTCTLIDTDSLVQGFIDMEITLYNICNSFSRDNDLISEKPLFVQNTNDSIVSDTGNISVNTFFNLAITESTNSILLEDSILEAISDNVQANMDGLDYTEINDGSILDDDTYKERYISNITNLDDRNITIDYNTGISTNNTYMDITNMVLDNNKFLNDKEVTYNNTDMEYNHYMEYNHNRNIDYTNKDIHIIDGVNYKEVDFKFIKNKYNHEGILMRTRIYF